MTQSDTSFYRLYVQKMIDPVIFYDKTPIRSEEHKDQLHSVNTLFKSKR